MTAPSVTVKTDVSMPDFAEIRDNAVKEMTLRVTHMKAKLTQWLNDQIKASPTFLDDPSMLRVFYTYITDAFPLYEFSFALRYVDDIVTFRVDGISLSRRDNTFGLTFHYVAFSRTSDYRATPIVNTAGWWF